MFLTTSRQKRVFFKRLNWYTKHDLAGANLSFWNPKPFSFFVCLFVFRNFSPLQRYSNNFYSFWVFQHFTLSCIWHHYTQVKRPCPLPSGGLRKTGGLYLPDWWLYFCKQHAFLCSSILAAFHSDTHPSATQLYELAEADSPVAKSTWLFYVYFSCLWLVQVSWLQPVF